MVDPIELAAKTDRELLLLTASKVNEMADNLGEACAQIKVNTNKLIVLETKTAQDRRALYTTISVVGTVLMGLIISWLRHIGIFENVLLPLFMSLSSPLQSALTFVRSIS